MVFNLSIPPDDEEFIVKVAKENERSKTAQLRLIIREWIEKEQRKK